MEAMAVPVPTIGSRWKLAYYDCFFAFTVTAVADDLHDDCRIRIEYDRPAPDYMDNNEVKDSFSWTAWEVNIKAGTVTVLENGIERAKRCLNSK